MLPKINIKTYTSLYTGKIPVYEFKEFADLMRKQLIAFIESEIPKQALAEFLLSGEYSVKLDYDNIAKFCKTWFLHLKIPLCFVYQDTNNMCCEMAWFVTGTDAVVFNSKELILNGDNSSD